MNKKQLSGKRKAVPGKKQTTASRSSRRLTRDDMAALEQLDHLLELQRRREQLAASIPPGIKTTQEMLANSTVLYHFAHEELGALGVLRIAPVPSMVPPGMTAQYIHRCHQGQVSNITGGKKAASHELSLAPDASTRLPQEGSSTWVHCRFTTLLPLFSCEQRSWSALE